MSQRSVWAGVGIPAILCVVVLSTLPARAEFKDNPDPNTLWIEDGSNIATGDQSSDQYWATGTPPLNITAAPDNAGFILDAAGDAHAAGRYVKFDPAYPYITWEITRVENGTGYRAFGIRALGNNPAFGGMVTHIQPGIYTSRTHFLFPEPKTAFLRLELYNAKVTLKYLKVVKTPDNYAEINTDLFKTKGYLELGDEVQFKVVLAEPAEDVTLRFFHSYIMPPLSVNGSQTLQLKPVNEQNKIWSARVKITSCAAGNLKPGKQFTPGEFLVKAVVLGGKIDTPLWTNNPVEFRFTPAPAPGSNTPAPGSSPTP
jgi:hypothetical protein